MDLKNSESIIEAARIAADVDIIVNNAATSHVSNPLADNAISSLSDEINVNVFGLIRVAQAFAPVLGNNGGGAFVQLNSVVSMKCFSDFSTYSASKAAAYSIT